MSNPIRVWKQIPGGWSRLPQRPAPIYDLAEATDLVSQIFYDLVIQPTSLSLGGPANIGLPPTIQSLDRHELLFIMGEGGGLGQPD